MLLFIYSRGTNPELFRLVAKLCRAQVDVNNVKRNQERDTRVQQEDVSIFLDCMARHHCQHLASDIDQFTKTVMEEVADKNDMKQKMVDKWSIKPSLAEKTVDILQFVTDKEEITTENIVTLFGFTATSTKRYLRQLTEFGYLEAHGGNKNRTYSKREN